MHGDRSLSGLVSKLDERTALVAVIGLGYVGLPLGLTLSDAGFRVLGFDTDEQKVRSLSEARSYIHHIPSERVETAVRAGRLAATSDFSRLDEPDAIIICVPTPLNRHREPDMSFVRKTCEAIAARLRRGQLVVLESTTYPGTTDELVKGILDESGLSLGHDYLLAFSPEREDPGNRSFSTATIPKLVGGVDEESGRVTEQLYRLAFQRVVRVADARVAEAAKLTENIFRGVNIALVNELKMVFERMGIDIWQVLDAAETKPFGFMRFNPGPGWGGHCIPIDPFYMSWKAREYDVQTKFIELAGEVNVHMPDYVVRKVQEALNQRGKPVRGARIMLLGIAYKADIDDCRESPAFPVLERLLRLGAQVTYHDPFVPAVPRTRAHPELEDLRSVPLDVETLERLDALVLLTSHRNVNYEFILQHAPLIVDTRGVYPTGPKVVKA